MQSLLNESIHASILCASILLRQTKEIAFRIILQGSRTVPLFNLRTPRKDQKASVTIKHVYTKKQRVNAQCNAPSIAHAPACKRTITTPLSRVYMPFDKNTSVKERHRA